MCTDLIVIVGATAVGKTAATIHIARELGCPVINADSRQLYASMHIGTASPTTEQLAVAKHYFVGTLPHPTCYYSAAQFETDAMHLLTNEIHGPAILSGGSMLYIDAVCKGIDDIPTITDEIRTKMKQRMETEGLEALVSELRTLDPEYASIADLNNPKRVIHALEICHQTGGTYTSLRTNPRKERPFRIVKIGLERDRNELYERINKRVDDMMKEGLLDEVRSLVPYKNENSLNTVGYKELFAYLNGDCTLNFAIEKIKRNTRVYSKKQMTWFKHDDSIHWFHPDNINEIMSFISQQCSNLTL